jgi:molybdate transport system substrate-binding protein
MKKSLCLIFTLLFSLTILVGCSSSGTKTTTENTTTTTLNVCAAASFTDVFKEIQPAFEKETGIKLAVNYGSSGTLQKQIENGAPCDVFLSASTKQVDALISEKLVDSSTKSTFLKNKLVLVVSKEYASKIKTAADLTKYNVKIALGEPTTVPAGDYGKQALTNLKLWDPLQGKIVYEKDVKGTLNLVETGNAAAGIVYLSDTTGLKSSSMNEIFDESTHKPIIYVSAIIKASKNQDAAKKFIEYLKSDSAATIFKKYKFITL